MLSDQAVDLLFRDPVAIHLASTLKGWLFVGVTALLLYSLIERPLGKRAALSSMPDVRLRSLLFPLIFVIFLIVALTASVVAQTFKHHQEKEVARLQAIADLKSQQIADWLRERQKDAHFLQTSKVMSERYRRWIAAGDPKISTEIRSRLQHFLEKDAFRSIFFLDEPREILSSSEINAEGAPLAIAPLLRTAARQVTTTQKPIQLGPYRDATGRLNLDFVTFLPAFGGTPGPIVVLRVNPSDYLYPTLQSWPVPTRSGETLLFRRDGDQVLFLNELRQLQDTAAKLRVPIDTEKLLAAQLLRGEVREGAMLEGVDYRNVPAMGVARTVPGTDWFLMAKLDREEVFAEAVHDSLWICLSGALAIFMATIAAFLLHQRRHLLASLRERETQADKLRSMQLLSLIHI